MRRYIAALVGVFCLAASSPGSADDPDDQIYFISMRAPSDVAPSFVTAGESSNGDQMVAFGGCDGVTYYLSQADSDAVSSALAAGETVQLHAAPDGTAPEDAPIVCLVQASQGSD
jgi:hypothetical protein